MGANSADSPWLMHPVNQNWAQVDPKSSQVPYLKNPRSGYISRRNTEGGFVDRIVKALKT